MVSKYSSSTVYILSCKKYNSPTYIIGGNKYNCFPRYIINTIYSIDRNNHICCIILSITTRYLSLLAILAKPILFISWTVTRLLPLTSHPFELFVHVSYTFIAMTITTIKCALSYTAPRPPILTCEPIKQFSACAPPQRFTISVETDNLSDHILDYP